VTAVRVEGCCTSLPDPGGAMEDTTDLILNREAVPLKMHVDHPKMLTLLPPSRARCAQAHHPRPTSRCSIPEAYVATLGAGSDALAVEMRVKHGRATSRGQELTTRPLAIG